MCIVGLWFLIWCLPLCDHLAISPIYLLFPLPQTYFTAFYVQDYCEDKNKDISLKHFLSILFATEREQAGGIVGRGISRLSAEQGPMWDLIRGSQHHDLSRRQTFFIKPLHLRNFAWVYVFIFGPRWSWCLVYSLLRRHCLSVVMNILSSKCH